MKGRITRCQVFFFLACLMILWPDNTELYTGSKDLLSDILSKLRNKNFEKDSEVEGFLLSGASTTLTSLAEKVPHKVNSGNAEQGEGTRSK